MKKEDENYLKVRKWYMKEYPADTEGEGIEENVTFEYLYQTLAHNPDSFYDVVGDIDSLIRERIFDKLAQLWNTSYDNIYDMWMGNYHS